MSTPTVYDARDFLTEISSPYSFVETIGTDGAGFAVVEFPNENPHSLNRELAVSLLSAIGALVAVYPGDGVWTDLSVRLDADPIRTHGVGENPFHMDLVDRDRAPRYIALYCERRDPGEGGFTCLADMWRVAENLSKSSLMALSLPAYSYFTDSDVYGVGSALPKFSIFPPQVSAGHPIRFTSKMLPHLRSGLHVDVEIVNLDLAVSAFEETLQKIGEPEVRFQLAPYQMIVFDQYRYAHSRSPLGADQAKFAPGSRRLLKQTYVASCRCAV